MTHATQRAAHGRAGRLVYADADRAAYRALRRHHYRDRPPATFCRVRAAWFVDRRTGQRRLVGVAVLAWPVASIAARLRWLRQTGWRWRDRLAFANSHIRTIARVIVHPQFRAIGVGRRLVRDLVCACPTRFIEASAVMGAFNTVFTAAGLSRVPSLPGEPAYFILDREAAANR